MQFFTALQFLLGLTATTTLASPIEVAAPAEGAASSLEARDTVKLNQYRSLSDCQNDKDILYHAAPVSGKCYTLDDATNAYFLNSGGYWYCKRWFSYDCSGDWVGFGPYAGSCHDRTENGKRAVSIMCS